jgi:hypothetical protein
MITRNVALFTRLSEPLQTFVFEAVNSKLPEVNRFYDVQSLIHSAAASTLLDTTPEFTQAITWTRQALEKSINAYKSDDSRSYAEGYINHLLDGGPIPQPLTITVAQAIKIRMRVDTAITKVKPAKKGKK